ncbi:MAG TPA: SDR family NAD(P)-dependent oxidoreductase [Steroidobacteraceae bacterium]|nr:SDR family NAD(P)-dependent oxidoreductase [Steroidobacteraceae bacterium]
MNLTGKVFIITGALGALGQAVTVCLTAHGAKLALLGNRVRPGVEHPAGALIYTGVDLSRKDAASAIFERVFKEMDRIDGLVNLAGGFQWEKFAGGSLETWESMFRSNLLTAVVSCGAVLPHLLRAKRGAIVNIGATGANKATCGMGAYAASKAGVVKLTEALADEVKDQGITVNAVLPSIIDTPLNRANMPDADFTRWVSPMAVAEATAFLVSDLARAISGAALPLAGRA